MKILPLAQCPEHATILAGWHHGEWRALYDDWSFEVCLAELQSQRDPDHVPTTLVAVSEHGGLLGSVSLVHDDLPGYEHLTPWLASLYVKPEARGRGVGSRLVSAALAEAHRLGIRRLYLFTPEHEDYYSRRGWSYLERASAAGHPVTIMCRFTAPDASSAG